MATVTLGRLALTIALGRKVAGAAAAVAAGAAQRRGRAAPAEAEAEARGCRGLCLPPAVRDEMLRAFQMDPAPLWSIGERPLPGTEEDGPRRR